MIILCCLNCLLKLCLSYSPSMEVTWSRNISWDFGRQFWMTDRPSISWWRRQMETLSALLAICAGNSPLTLNSPHKGQCRGTLMFSLISAWINGWVNNGEAGDMRRHCAHYDGIVMCSEKANYKKNGRRLSDLDNKAFDSEIFIHDTRQTGVVVRVGPQTLFKCYFF